MFGDDVYEVLMLMLRESPSLTGVDVLFGEENTNSEDVTLGSVTMVPNGGPWNDPTSQPGYFSGANPALDNVWSTLEAVDFYLWSSCDPNATPPPTEIQHATSVCNLRRRVLDALQYQQPRGLAYAPTSGRWETFKGAQNRYGRAYVLTVEIEITTPVTMYPEATVRRTTLNPITINEVG